jgi:trimeric autotransporter adhesin
MKKINVLLLGLLLALFVISDACKSPEVGIASPTITALNCSGATFSAVATSGTSYTATASVPYSGGNGAAYSAGNAINSSGVTGLTATLSAGNLTTSTGGTASFVITGTPATAGTATFDINLGGQSCTLSLPVVASKAIVSSLTCTVAPANATSGTAYTGTVTMAYTGGNGAKYEVSTATSTGVEGLTATVAAGTLANGAGNLTYNITGTPASAGTATFTLSIGGQSCTVTITVAQGAPINITPAKDTVVVVYGGTSASVSNAYQGQGVSVAVNGADVTVTSSNTTKEIVYLLSGTTTKGSFKIYSEYKYNISMKGVSITNTVGPAINIQSTKKATIRILPGTTNTLIDGTTYTTSTEDQKGTFFSEGQLLFSGTGTLNITGNSKHALVADDYISISEANIIIKGAVSDGIHAKDYFVMESGNVSIVSSSDGITASDGYVALNGGAITVNCVDDGIAATYTGTDTKITPYVLIKGGVINVTTTGEKGNAIKSESYTTISSGAEVITLSVSGRGSKGIKTTGDFTLNTGTVRINTSGVAFYATTDADITAPAGINCDKNLSIKGGNLTINTTGMGGKGIGVDGTSTISGGNTNINVTGAKYTYSSTLSSDPKGFKTDGTFVMNGGDLTVSATDDGIKSDKSITVNNGNINVTKSFEGMESIIINIAGGVTNLTATNDGINTSYGTVTGGTEANDNSQLNVSGGVLIVVGSDAIDSNGIITLTGGVVIANGNEDVDYNGGFLVNGGTLIGAEPASNMTKPMSAASTQVGMFIKSGTQVAATSLIHIEDANGKDLLTYKPKTNVAYFHFSNPSLLKNTSYKIFFGGTYSGGSFVGNTTGWGLHTGGTYSSTGATLKSSPTTSASATVNTITF